MHTSTLKKTDSINRVLRFAEPQDAMFRKLEGGENVRTTEMRGWFHDTPEVGKGFIIYGPPVVEGMLVRMIYTSDVKKITKLDKGLGGFILDTITGSQYEVELI